MDVLRENDIEGIVVALEIMREDGYKPTEQDFLYYLCQLHTYKEAKWLASEFEKLGKSITKKLIHGLIIFTTSIDQCLELMDLLNKYKIKSVRSELFLLYAQLIIFSDDRDQATSFYIEAKNKGIEFSEKHLERTGDKDFAKAQLKKWKDQLNSVYRELGRNGYNSTRNISSKKLLQLAKQASSTPNPILINIKGFYRNLFIKELAKKLANGICQLCDKPAPFADKSGSPYLETHHIYWLARGGEDSIENTVALCPNCHKKMHVLDDEKDVQKLIKQIVGCKHTVILCLPFPHWKGIQCRVMTM